MPKNEQFLLDTHIWVWLLNGEPAIKKAPLFRFIANAGRQKRLFIASISVWEIAILEAKGRIAFSTDVTTWIKDAVSAPGLQMVQLLPEISIDSSRLPGQFHGDPADRIIVATSRFLRCPLITVDKKILAYAKSGYLDAVAL